MSASSSAPIVASHFFTQHVASMSTVDGPFWIPKVTRFLASVYHKLAS